MRNRVERFCYPYSLLWSLPPEGDNQHQNESSDMRNTPPCSLSAWSDDHKLSVPGDHHPTRTSRAVMELALILPSGGDQCSMGTSPHRGSYTVTVFQLPKSNGNSNIPATKRNIVKKPGCFYTSGLFASLQRRSATVNAMQRQHPRAQILHP